MGPAMNLAARENCARDEAACKPGFRGFLRRRTGLGSGLLAAATGSLVLPIVSGLFLISSAVAQPQSQGAGQGSGQTQGSTKSTASAKSVTATPPSIPSAVRQSEVGPTWKELTPAQQTSLKPLAANWSGIGEGQKRKWLAVSKNYPALPAPEQAKLHSRMTEWASLSQQQRSQARLNFAETKKLSPDEKAANWQAYQALSPEDRQKLAANASPTPAGAAVAVKPVAPQKLATVPTARTDTKHANSGALGIHGNPAVDRNTLLPRPAFTEDPAVRKN